MAVGYTASVVGRPVGAVPDIQGLQLDRLPFSESRIRRRWHEGSDWKGRITREPAADARREGESFHQGVGKVGDPGN